jgi:hypothetical protein
MIDPGCEGEAEAADEGPGSADGRYAVRQPLRARPVVDDKTRIDAARRFGGDQVDDATLDVRELVIGAPEQPVGQGFFGIARHVQPPNAI